MSTLFAQSDFGSTVSFGFEVLLVLVFFGLALYAVCRSSRRN